MSLNLSDLMPLDVGLIHGKGVVSDAIQLLEFLGTGEGKYSHMFVVITTDILELPGMVPGKRYSFEITKSGKFNDDVLDISGRSHLGVQVRDLQAMAIAQQKMGCTLYFSKLRNSPYRDGYEWSQPTFNTVVMYQRELKITMQNIYQSYKNMGYDFDPRSLFSFTMPSRRKKIKDHGVFCSEFVGIVFNKLNIVAVSEPRDVIPVTLEDAPTMDGASPSERTFASHFEHPIMLDRLK